MLEATSPSNINVTKITTPPTKLQLITPIISIIRQKTAMLKNPNVIPNSIPRLNSIFSINETHAAITIAVSAAISNNLNLETTDWSSPI